VTQKSCSIDIGMHDRILVQGVLAHSVNTLNLGMCVVCACSACRVLVCDTKVVLNRDWRTTEKYAHWI
jgi:hypothetical protein